MNGLQPGIRLTSFVGEELLQLCFGAHQLQIHFANRIQVMVESECVLQGMSPDPIRIDNYSSAASSLCRLLSAKVLSASRADDGGLLLRFANGAELHVLNDTQENESFQIHLDGKIYVA